MFIFDFLFFVSFYMVFLVNGFIIIKLMYDVMKLFVLIMKVYLMFVSLYSFEESIIELDNLLIINVYIVFLVKVFVIVSDVMIDYGDNSMINCF